MITVGFNGLGFNPISIPNVLNFKVKNYSWHAIGGPEQATIEVTGNIIDLWSLVGWLRYEVILKDTQLGPVWWGYINSVEIHTLSNYSVGVTLDGMYNRIKAAYTVMDERETTDWVENTKSITKYGKKEFVYSFATSTPDEALAAAAKMLAQTGIPIRTVEINDKDKFKATLTCKGWWNTLDWQRNSHADAIEQYTNTDKNLMKYQAFGWGNGTTPNYVTYAAQGFTNTGEDFTLLAAQVFVMKRDEPDDLIVSICVNSAGNPGSVLDSFTIVQDDISTFPTGGWVRGEFTNGITITSGTSYWIRCAKNGANDVSEQYYWLGCSKLGYTSGAAKMYLNGVWTNITDKDFNFIVEGSYLNSRQIDDALNDAQFINSVQVLATGGGSSSPFRNGDNTIKTDVEELMEKGTAANLRFLSTVSLNRIARVYEEPTATAYYQEPNGRLFTTTGHNYPKSKCPVGFWMKLKDLIPSGLSFDQLVLPDTIFIERSEYNVEQDDLTLEARNVPSPWS